MKRVLRRQRTLLGRVIRDITRKLDGVSDATSKTLQLWLERAQRLHRQRDLGYRGREVDGVEILHGGKPKRLTRRQWAWVKRRQAIEPIIGHVKDDCGMRRCRLKGARGDALHAIACAAGYNLRWLLRWIALFCAWLSAVLTECMPPWRSMPLATAI